MVHKLRKGTRSCRECRRRKTRCIFPAGQEICKECNYHARRCVDQGQALLSGEADITDNRPNLRVRVARLESMIERLVQSDPKGAAEALDGLDLSMHVRRDSTSSRRRSTHEVVLRGDIRSTNTSVDSPLSTLFDNDMLKRNDDTSQLYRSSSYDPDDRRTKSRQELLSKILLEPNIFKVLHIAGSWWLPWRSLWPPLTEGDEKSSLVDFVHFNLAQEGLINVASGLLCIAISLQQLRPGADDYDIPLSAPPNELANNLLTAVDQLALADDDLLASLDGLEALVLRAKSYVNASNQPRKSWLLIRRAISMAQLMDLPRTGPDQETAETAETTRRQRFMGALFETDRFMSLLMGLPYAVDDNFNEKVAKQVLHSPANIITQMRALRRIVALVAGKVNDRNASSTPEVKESTVHYVQQTLDDAASTLPCDWWNVETHSSISHDPQSSHEHLLTQLWFYQVQSFLHLPMMLKPATDTRFERSRLVCLSSSRNLLRVYQALRQPRLAPYSSKCVDFQALIAAVLVLLGLLQQGSQIWQSANAGYREDVDLINTTRGVFELSSMEQAGSIARQGVHMIDSLGAFVADGERNDFIRTATLFVPYFGTISVQSGRDKAASERTDSVAYSDSSSCSQRSSQQQQQQRPASFSASDNPSPTASYPQPPKVRAMMDGNANMARPYALPAQLVEETLPVANMHRMSLGNHQQQHQQHQHYMHTSAAQTARRSSLPTAPLSLPLAHPACGPSFRPNGLAYDNDPLADPRHEEADTSPDVDVDVDVDVEGGYVDVDNDWQRLMVGAELVDRDWNVDVDGHLGGGGDLDLGVARVVGGELY